MVRQTAKQVDIHSQTQTNIQTKIHPPFIALQNVQSKLLNINNDIKHTQEYYNMNLNKTVTFRFIQ